MSSYDNRRLMFKFTRYAIRGNTFFIDNRIVADGDYMDIIVMLADPTVKDELAFNDLVCFRCRYDDTWNLEESLNRKLTSYNYINEAY